MPLRPLSSFSASCSSDEQCFSMFATGYKNSQHLAQEYCSFVQHGVLSPTLTTMHCLSIRTDKVCARFPYRGLTLTRQLLHVQRRQLCKVPANATLGSMFSGTSTPSSGIQLLHRGESAQSLTPASTPGSTRFRTTVAPKKWLCIAQDGTCAFTCVSVAVVHPLLTAVMLRYLEKQLYLSTSKLKRPVKLAYVCWMSVCTGGQAASGKQPQHPTAGSESF